jgi:hypothetical protein
MMPMQAKLETRLVEACPWCHMYSLGCGDETLLKVTVCSVSRLPGIHDPWCKECPAPVLVMTSSRLCPRH